MNLFEKELTAIVTLLNKHEVRFILVGGLAVNFHGFSRSTGDVDLWLEDTPSNRSNLVNALKEFGVNGAEAFHTFPLIAGFAEVLLDNGIYVDLMAQMIVLKQNDFAMCLQAADEYKLNDDCSIKVLHINHLIKEKEGSGREKDLNDAEKLKNLFRDKKN